MNNKDASPKRIRLRSDSRRRAQDAETAALQAQLAEANARAAALKAEIARNEEALRARLAQEEDDASRAPGPVLGKRRAPRAPSVPSLPKRRQAAFDVRAPSHANHLDNPAIEMAEDAAVLRPVRFERDGTPRFEMRVRQRVVLPPARTREERYQRRTEKREQAVVTEQMTSDETLRLDIEPSAAAREQIISIDDVGPWLLGQLNSSLPRLSIKFGRRVRVRLAIGVRVQKEGGFANDPYLDAEGVDRRRQFWLPQFTSTSQRQLLAEMRNSIEQIPNFFKDVVVRQSGLSFDEFTHAQAYVSRLSPHEAGAGRIETPAWCAKNKGIRNIISPPGRCFEAAVMTALVSGAEMKSLGKHDSRFTSYTSHPRYKEINWAPIKKLAAVGREDVIEFMRANPWLSVTVHGVELREERHSESGSVELVPEACVLWPAPKDQKIVSKLKHEGESQIAKTRIDLLLIRRGFHGAEPQCEYDLFSETDPSEFGHFAAITDLSAFYHTTGSSDKPTIECLNCTMRFDKRYMDKLDEHVQNDCGFKQYVLPKAGEVVKHYGSQAMGATQVCRTNVSCDLETLVFPVLDPAKALAAVGRGCDGLAGSGTLKTAHATTLQQVSYSLTVKTLDDWNDINNRTFANLIYDPEHSTEILDVLRDVAEHLNKTMPFEKLDKTKFEDSFELRSRKPCRVCGEACILYDKYEFCPEGLDGEECEELLQRVQSYTKKRREMRTAMKKLVAAAERDAIRTGDTHVVEATELEPEEEEEEDLEEPEDKSAEEPEQDEAEEQEQEAPAPILKRRFTWLSPGKVAEIQAEAKVDACRETGFVSNEQLDSLADRRNEIIRNFAKYRAVEHHCHIHGDCQGKTDHGVFGICHADCNKRMQYRNEANVWFHNGKNFDFHFVLDMLGRWRPNGDDAPPQIRVLPATREAFREIRVTFKLDAPAKTVPATKREKAAYRKANPDATEDKISALTKEVPAKFTLIFRDSFSHFLCSLDKVTSKLTPQQRVATHALAREIAGGDDDWHAQICDLFKKKGCFPYSWLSEISKLKQAAFPLFEECQNDLLPGAPMTREQHKAMVDAFKLLECKSMADYLIVYNKLDTTLLADALEAYSRAIYAKFELDPLFYCSSPACAYQCCLKSTNQKLELISDTAMYQFELNAATGGLVTTGTCRLAYANNPKMRTVKPGEAFVPGVHFDPAKPETYIVPVDVNSLYPSQASQMMPTGDHQWEPTTDIGELMAWDLEEGDRGFIATIDGFWPAHLHKQMKLYPVMPIRRTTDSQKDGAEHSAWLKRHGVEGSTGEKLVADLYPRINYGVHGPVLQWAVKHGFVVTQIHKVLSFAQSRWMKSYFDVCVQWRKQAKAAENDFEADLAKLFMNSAIGKFACDVTKFKTVKVVNRNDRMAIRRTLKNPTFDGVWYGQCGDLLYFLMKKKNARLNFPSYVGHAVTCVSKLYITRLLHDHFYAVFGEFVELVYTDTDSAVLYITARPGEDVYETVENDQRIASQLDFSEYPKGHLKHNPTTAGTLGLSKVEAMPLTKGSFPPGMPTMCVALCKKMWALQLQGWAPAERSAMLAAGKGKEVASVDKKLKDKVRAKGVAQGWMCQHVKASHYERLITHPHEKSERAKATVGAFRAHNHEMRIDIATKKALSSCDDTMNVSEDGKTALPWGYLGPK